MIVLLLLVLLICTLTGSLVGYPHWGLAVGLLVDAWLVWSNTGP